MRFGPGDFFGERALMANCRTLRTVSVPAEGQGPVVVECITRAGFDEVLGRGGGLAPVHITRNTTWCSLDLRGARLRHENTCYLLVVNDGANADERDE